MTYYTEGTDDGPDTYDEWTDKLGQTYRAGDFIAYASISGKSPQMVFARVLEIRRKDSKGLLVWHRRYDRESHAQVIEAACKVKVLPLLDARNFWRSEQPKPVTLSIPENVIRITPPDEWTDEHRVADLAALAEELR